MSNIGTTIRKLRLENGMTLEDLGKKVGVGKSTVRKWENGIISNMRRDKIAKVAEVFNVSPSYLMGWDSNLDSATESAQAAQEILENKDLRKLFDAAKDVDSEGLKALHTMALALQRKERKDDDAPGLFADFNVPCEEELNRICPPIGESEKSAG